MLGQEGPAAAALKRAADASADFPGKDGARLRLSVLAIDAATANPARRKDLEDYLREQPKDPVALIRLGQLQERDGARDQAVKTYENILDANPLFAPAMRRLAILYGQLSGDNPKAFDLTLKARQAYPQDPEIAKALGILNYRRDLYPRAAELLREAATMRKDDPELLYYLGQAYQQLKQWSECKTTLTQAVTLKLESQFADKAKRSLDECTEMLPQ